MELVNRELKEDYHFKYLGSALERVGYCTREIKMRNVIAREAFIRKISLLTNKINIELSNRGKEGNIYTNSQNNIYNVCFYYFYNI